MHPQSPRAELMPIQGSLLPHILLLFALPVSLTIPNFPLRRPLAISILVSLIVTAHRSSPFTAIIGKAQPWSLLWPNHLAVLTAHLVVPSPESVFWRLDRGPDDVKSARDLGLYKLKWAAAFIINLRGVRWSHEVKNVPRQSRRLSRRKFMVVTVCDTIFMLVMTDMLLQLSIRVFWSPEQAIVDSKHLTIRDANWRWNFIKTLTFAAGPYFFMRMQYDIFALVAVAAGISQPDDWPSLFGKVSDATSVRQFWGSYWHQSLRRVSSPKFHRALW